MTGLEMIPLKALGPAKPRKLMASKIGLGRCAEGLHAAAGEAIGQTDPRKTAPQRVAGKHREAVGILREVLPVKLAVRRLGQQVGIDTGIDRKLANLVVVIVALETP